MGTRICQTCKQEKSLMDFDSKIEGMRVVIDPVCIKCRQSGRMTIEELMNRKHAGGRPRVRLPIQEIRNLYDSGLRCKAIASRLRGKGYMVSASTIWRILKEM